MPRQSAAPPLPPPSSLAPLHYVVAMPEPQSHEYHVTLEIPAVPGRHAIDLVFPAWAPGSYMVRDFARHIYDLDIATDRGQPLPVTRLDKQRWRVQTEGSAVRVRYRVFAFETSVRTSFLGDDHAYWNGTSLFFFVEGDRDRPCEITVQAPDGWHVSTALPRGRHGRYRARDVDQLYDSPFEVGTHRRSAFRVGRTIFEIAFYGRTNADLQRLRQDLRKVVMTTGEIFAGFPFDRYLFIIHALPARGGGLEHANSTTLDIAGMSFEDERGYQAFAELAAHEFFHAWNVKRIADRVLGPFDYTGENYTRLLWFHEGFTDYMESLLLLRAGIIDQERYLDDLAAEWQRYASRPGRNVSPLSELSFEAWIKQYRPSDNHTNRMVSYYDKGKWAALVLEIELRLATGGKRGIIELFQKLWVSHGQPSRGLTEADLRAAVDRLAGKSMEAFFVRYIDGTAELPVPALLKRAGLLVSRAPAWEGEEDLIRARRLQSWTGLSFAAGGSDRAVVRNVIPGSPAWRAGLTYGDEVVALDGGRITGATATRRFADQRPGTPVQVTFFRQDLLRQTRLVVARSPETVLELSVDQRAKGLARAVRKSWIGA